MVACDENDSNQPLSGPLPEDPNEWVCQNSIDTVSEEEIELFCESAVGFGDPAPLNLQNPPPLSELNAKNQYDQDFLKFIRARTYVNELGWIGDMIWRMTGPYVGEIGGGDSFGVHPAVRIYYSPEVVDWLCNDRVGEIPDGAMIIKEMHGIDEDLDIRLNNQSCMEIRADVEPDSWAIMVKQNDASHDGWYWVGFSEEENPITFAWQVGNPPIFNASGITSNDFFQNGLIPDMPDPLWFPTGYVFSSTNKIPNIVFPYNEYGNYCINCHASAINESTFSSLENILSPGIEYKQYKSNQPPEIIPEEFLEGHQPGLIGLITQDPTQLVELIPAMQPEVVDGYNSPFTHPLPQPNNNFLEFYDQLDEIGYSDVWPNRLPATNLRSSCVGRGRS